MIFQTTWNRKVVSIIDNTFKDDICVMIMVNIRETNKLAVNSTYKTALESYFDLVNSS